MDPLCYIPSPDHLTFVKTSSACGHHQQQQQQQQQCRAGPVCFYHHPPHYRGCVKMQRLDFTLYRQSHLILKVDFMSKLTTLSIFFLLFIGFNITVINYKCAFLHCLLTIIHWQKSMKNVGVWLHQETICMTPSLNV